MNARTQNGTQEHLIDRKEPAKTGDEVDMVTGWRKVTNNHWKRIKQRMSRRNRRRAKRILRQLRKDDPMKKLITIIIITICLAASMTIDAQAGGDKVRGDNGAGAVSQHQVSELPYASRPGQP